MSIRFSVDLDDPHTEDLLRYLHERFGDNVMDKLDLLSTTRKWLELEDRIPTAFTPYRVHEKQSALSVLSDGDSVPSVS
jgi:hypothetical protein